MAVGTLRQEVTFVEARGEGFVGEVRGHVGIGGEKVAQLTGARRRLAASCAGPRRTRPRAKPGLLDQGEEHAAAAVETEPALDVLAHPVRPDDQTFDEAARLDQHVVKQDRGIGEEYALGGRVA